MLLIDVYDKGLWNVQAVLWLLLGERKPEQSISHKEMPTWDQHCAFIASKPYLAWYFFTSPAGFPAGAVYLTKQRQVGVSVLKAHRRQGLARQALASILKLHPGRCLANINPANEASIALFRSLGFVGPIQITLERL